MTKVAQADIHIKGKDKTKTAFNSVQGRLKRMKDSMLGVQGAVGLLGVASAGVFAKMAKDAANTADEIRKMSSRVGITTDALQEMRFAFGLAGVEGDVLTKGLLNFSKALGEARAGTGALTTFLRKSDEALLGQLTSARNTTHALDIFFKALGRTKNQSDKMALSSAALGRAGKLITTAFENGADAFEKAREEAHRLGLIIDKELLENAEAMNDQLSIVSQVISVQLTKAFLELAPSIQSAAKALTDFLVGMKNGESILFHNSQKMSLFERIVRSIALELDKAGMAFHKFIGDEKGFKQFEERFKDTLRRIRESQERQEREPAGIIGLSKKPPIGGSGAIPPMSKLQEDAKRFRVPARKFWKDYLPQGILRDSGKERFDNIPKPIEGDFIRQEKLEKRITLEYDRQLQILMKRQKGEEELIKFLEKKWEVEDRAGRALTKQEEKKLKQAIQFQTQLEKQILFQQEIANIGERVFDRLGDGIVFSMQRGESAMESFRDAAIAALFDVQREMFKLMVFQPLKDAATPFLSSIGKAIGGSLFSNSGGSAGGNTDFSQQGFANGGFVSGRSPILVGEKGPEIFMPTGSGNVIPNHKLGGGGVNVTLNISTGVQSTVRAEVMGLMPIITSNVKSAVAEARQRGGAFSEAMGV